jgi:hypothetical protein
MATAKTAPRATKTATEAFETFTAGSTEAVRENIDRGIAAFSEASAFGKQNMEAWVASATAAQKGFEVLSARAVAFQKAALENHVAATKSLMTRSRSKSSLKSKTTTPRAHSKPMSRKSRRFLAWSRTSPRKRCSRSTSA